MRYSLRKQLVLNLGTLMLLGSLLLSALIIQIARHRFLRDRKRHLAVVAHLIHQTVLSRLEGPLVPRQRMEGLLAIPEAKSAMSRPESGMVLLKGGRIWRKFGHLPQGLSKKLSFWLRAGRSDEWSAYELDGKLHWQRLITLRKNFQPIGVLWLSWNLESMEKDFFSYQALLFLYLMSFNGVILLILLLFLEYKFVRPLGRLGEAFEGLVEKKSHVSLETESIRRDEIGDLARAFLRTQRELEKQTASKESYIEQLEKTNQVLERAQEELVEREKMATIGRMAAGVAHEVGNPLSAIVGYSELLSASEKLGEVEKDLAVRIFKEANRIDHIIRELLNYARPIRSEEAGDPKEAIEEAVEILVLQKRFREIEVRKEYPFALPQVELSTSRLIQVLINLLINASDAIEGKGEIVITAKVKQKEEGREEVIIEVRDNGVGISAHVRGRIFEPFFTTKPTGKGIGLGLALCRRIVTGSGGKIELVETSAKGTTFCICLPVVQASHSTKRM